MKCHYSLHKFMVKIKNFHSSDIGKRVEVFDKIGLCLGILPGLTASDFQFVP